VFRQTALTIVLTLIAAPSWSLVCQADCDPPVAASASCHDSDGGSTASVASSNDCVEPPLLALTPTRGDLRRGIAPNAGTQATLSGGHYTDSARVSCGRWSHRIGQPLVPRRPLPPILRI
jgi:hypothetical protein